MHAGSFFSVIKKNEKIYYVIFNAADSNIWNNPITLWDFYLTNNPWSDLFFQMQKTFFVLNLLRN